MTAASKLFEFIPERYFVKSLKENRIGHIKMAFVRETINPLIIRSTDPEATISIVTVDQRELVEIPPRKLKSREKLLGLMICREFGVVDDKVRYNVFEGAEYLNNPNSVLFGDTSTKSGDTAGLVSRAIYDWAYSLRDVKDITDKLQHNALSEAGTMIDESTGEMRQSLYLTEYVLPNTFFPHFITVDNITPELFAHLLSCVLNQRRYGAQSTTNANNINNHLVAAGFSDFEKPINSYTISRAWNDTVKNANKDAVKKDEPLDLASVTEFIQKQMEAHYGKSLVGGSTGKTVDDLVDWVTELWKNNEIVREDEEKKKSDPLCQIYETAKSSVDAYLKEIKMVNVGSTTKGSSKRAIKKKTEAPQQADNSLLPAMEDNNEDSANKD